MMSAWPAIYAYWLFSAQERDENSRRPAPREPPPRSRHIPPDWRPLLDEDAWLLPDGSKVTGLDLARLGLTPTKD